MQCFLTEGQTSSRIQCPISPGTRTLTVLRNPQNDYFGPRLLFARRTWDFECRCAEHKKDLFSVSAHTTVSRQMYLHVNDNRCRTLHFRQAQRLPSTIKRAGMAVEVPSKSL